ncbi:MAG: hypothetical protein GTO45_39380 [Candidatus Aminicenantes bacterium]|nr:hypothetical protein [Candidatus Aminicenantes bacterium]NIM84691.1 hypothetical protein [Candidatus Aminicenantes bacterium]NIN24190.1 hypothetical protein [Candidatus Aminicenantes bacterium]NIN47915.1 hypothetical protein [Candidatus Aminicenantes bacterium]NIN90853.1 hypothetical protein [Candidatus Aminicenantes bacterium]
MVNYDSFMVTLSTVFGASLLVERFLEFIKNISEPFIGGKHKRIIPPLKDVDRKIDELKKDIEAGKQDGEWDERYPLNTVLVEPATDPDDGTVSRAFVIQLMGFALGIVAAHLFGVRLFETLTGGSSPIAPWEDFLLTGLLIGGGSAPIHMLMRFVTRRKMGAPSGNGMDFSEEKENQEKPGTGEEPPVVDELDIPYSGGVDRDKLEWRHVRKENPTLIVYHHTAMKHNSTFEDVVRVIKSRKDSSGNHWITGYNCVIMADGAIKPFCRWDRYGNHARGYNMKSLGIAFNGNFETDPRIPNSNPDGRYGPSRPTEAQIKAGARVVALWTFLYDIAPDFDNTIIPHNKIAQKACPGSNFPYEEFSGWVEFYRNQWEKSPGMIKRIEAFKMKPYLYVSKSEK